MKSSTIIDNDEQQRENEWKKKRFIIEFALQKIKTTISVSYFHLTIKFEYKNIENEFKPIIGSMKTSKTDKSGEDWVEKREKENLS